MKKNKKPIISVIVVTYNQKNYLFETIQSILDQTYPWIEIIIADDCSLEYNHNEIDKYIQLNKKNNIVSYTIYSNNKNLGTVKNLNNAIKISKGDYIKPIGGDDAFFDKWTFERQINHIIQSDKDMIFGFPVKCDEELKPIKSKEYSLFYKNLIRLEKLSEKKKLSYFVRKDMFPFPTQAAIFKSDFFSTNGYYDEEYLLVEDLAMTYKIFYKNLKYGLMKEPAVLHRSNVGVSANLDIFSLKKSKYYKDLIKLLTVQKAKKNSFILNIYFAEKIRLYIFRDLFSVSTSIFRKIWLAITFCDAILFYSFSHPQKFIYNIMNIFKGVKK